MGTDSLGVERLLAKVRRVADHRVELAGDDGVAVEVNSFVQARFDVEEVGLVQRERTLDRRVQPVEQGVGSQRERHGVQVDADEAGEALGSRGCRAERRESAVGSSEEHAAAGGRVEYTGDGPVVTGLDRPPTAGGRDAGRGNEVSGRRLRGLGEPCLVGPCRRAVGAVRERRREAGE